MADTTHQDSLRSRGVRLTRQRRLLLDLIDSSGLHLDAESLYQMAKENDPKLNRVTVYRTLKLLKEGGLIDELDLAHFDGEKHYYETRLKQEHAHVICLRCGRVEEFFGEMLQNMRQPGGSQFGFEIVFARTEIRRLLLALPDAPGSAEGRRAQGRSLAVRKRASNLHHSPDRRRLDRGGHRRRHAAIRET